MAALLLVHTVHLQPHASTEWETVRMCLHHFSTCMYHCSKLQAAIHVDRQHSERHVHARKKGLNSDWSPVTPGLRHSSAAVHSR